MAVNNAFAIPVGQDYSDVISLDVIRSERKKKKIKYNKDGSISRIKCNKVAGKSSEVYAFCTKEEIASMIMVLDRHIDESVNNVQRQIACRNKLLFIIGINVGIRGSDLRTLQWSFFFDECENGKLKFKSSYVLQPMKQRKQKKFVKLFFNRTVQTAVNNYVSEYPFENIDDYLFASRKGDEPITVASLCRIIKDTAHEAGIEQNIGSHSLRKTWGFWCFHESPDKNSALVILQQCFNHNSTQTTMKYIGLLDEEIADMYYSIELGIDMI